MSPHRRRNRRPTPDEAQAAISAFAPPSDALALEVLDHFSAGARVSRRATREEIRARLRAMLPPEKAIVVDEFVAGPHLPLFYGVDRRHGPTPFDVYETLDHDLRSAILAT